MNLYKSFYSSNIKWDFDFRHPQYSPRPWEATIQV